MAQTYWESEVAKNLGIGSSTLRKYCLALEEAGYNGVITFMEYL
ncbi:hypothetical protein [Bacillus manliponensis]|nr:hypothetical protein [Bacillus manliponensis]